MTVQELISLLSDLDPSLEVRLGIQPNYPFEHAVRAVVTRSEFTESDPDSNYSDDVDVVYILEGGQLGYLSRNAWSV